MSQSRLEDAQILLRGLEDHALAAAPLARLHLAKGQADIARAILEQSLQNCPPYTLHQLPNLILLLEILLAGEEHEAVPRLIIHLSDLAQRTQSSQLLAQAAFIQGRFHLHTADLEAARQSFAGALDALRAFQQSLLAGQIRLNMARALQDVDRPGAIVWARAALATFERLGSAHEAAQSLQVLRALGAAGAAAPRLRQPLSKREIEIAELIAQGLTNREISDRLVISAKTVEHHVSRILAKLDLRSRTEIAALAASGKLNSAFHENRGTIRGLPRCAPDRESLSLSGVLSSSHEEPDDE